MEDLKSRWNADPLWSSMVDADREYKPSDTIIHDICTQCIMDVISDICDGDGNLSSHLRSITGKKLRQGDHITFSSSSGDKSNTIITGYIHSINIDVIQVKLNNNVIVDVSHTDVRRSDSIITKLSKTDINSVYDDYIHRMTTNNRGMASIIDIYMSMCMYMRLNPKVAYKYLNNSHKFTLINELDAKTNYLTNNADKIRKW